MDDHDVSSHYLAGFIAHESGRFWTYDKVTGEHFLGPPKSGAHLNDPGPEQLDRSLAGEIASPAIQALDKIRGRRALEPEDKLALGLYMAGMRHDPVPPDPPSLLEEAIATMTWTFLTFDDRPAFMTGDNPLFHFSHLGVGKPESEISFPVSSTILLWGTWRTDSPQGYIPVRHPVVREMNRRTASNAVRYVFHALEEDWIVPFLRKATWPTNRLKLTEPIA